MRGNSAYVSPECRIVVMAKEPTPGRVKTRMIPPLTPELAATCHASFVADTLVRIGRGMRVVDKVLAVDPAGAAPRLTELAASAGWTVVDQPEGDLGRRIHVLLSVGVVAGRRVIVLGADTPDLPVEFVSDSFSLLEKHEVVVGPATDGGYWLIGCRGRVPEIFGSEIDWGTPTVFRDTLKLLRAAGTEPALLPPWSDVDDWSALASLARRLAGGGIGGDGPSGGNPERSIEFLQGLRRRGFVL